jgi:hypothetical protein
VTVPILVDVYIWETNLQHNNFSIAGHVMITGACSQVVFTSQFPHEIGQESRSEGKNIRYTYTETVKTERFAPSAIWAVLLPDGDAFRIAVRNMLRIPRWGAIPAVGSKSHTHCARAASDVLSAGGLPINSYFNKTDDGGQILPRNLNKILSHLASVTFRNKRAFAQGSKDRHSWSVHLRAGCQPRIPRTPSVSNER